MSICPHDRGRSIRYQPGPREEESVCSQIAQDDYDQSQISERGMVPSSRKPNDELREFYEIPK